MYNTVQQCITVYNSVHILEIRFSVSYNFLDKNKTLTRDEPDGEDQPAEEYENSNFGVFFSGCWN